MLNRMYQAVCRYFTRRYVPGDDELDFAEALFKWKHGAGIDY